MISGVRRLALLIAGCGVVATAVLLVQSAPSSDPRPSLGPVVRVGSHPNSSGATQPPPESDDGDAGDDGGASTVLPRTPADAGDDGPDDSDEPDEVREDHDDLRDD